jgi:hypothetical protein
MKPICRRIAPVDKALRWRRYSRVSRVPSTSGFEVLLLTSGVGISNYSVSLLASSAAGVVEHTIASDKVGEKQFLVQARLTIKAAKFLVNHRSPLAHPGKVFLH